MNKLISIILFGVFAFSACKTTYKPINPKRPLKNFVPLAGSSTVYYSKYETSNLEYNSFIDAECAIDSFECFEYYFHNDTWEKIKGGTANLENTYHWHPFFDAYPVTIITHESAKSYCRWLTKSYHSKKRRKYKKVVFRLPTASEFKKLIESIEVDFSSDEFDYYKKFEFNVGIRPINYDGAMYQSDTRKYIQNKKGACNIIGNVNELTVDGESYGGNWLDVPSIASKPFIHRAPDPRIGFRVFMEILE